MERDRGRVVALRQQGLSVCQISTRLAAEGTPLNRTSVGEVLAEEGFGRLLHHPEPEASISPATVGRGTQLPRAATLDFTTWPDRVSSRMAGLLLAMPDLVALDLPGLARRAGYPGIRVIPAASWLLSLLALKLTATPGKCRMWTICCSSTRPRPCSPVWAPCRRSQPALRTPTAPATSTSARSWPVWIPT